MKIAAQILLILVLCTSQLVAQKVYKVKIVTDTGRTVKGILTKATADSLFIYPAHHEIAAYSVQDIARIDLRRKGAIGRGLSTGLLVGAVGGAALGAVAYQPGGWFDVGRGGEAAIGAILFAPLGGLFGVIVNIGSQQFKLKEDARHYNRFLSRVNQP
jgi:Zn-dependent protease